jgi:hypothetical protein
MAASALLALIAPIIRNGSPNRSCQGAPSAFRTISTVSVSASADRNRSPKSFRSFARSLVRTVVIHWNAQSRSSKKSPAIKTKHRTGSNW